METNVLPLGHSTTMVGRRRIKSDAQFTVSPWAELVPGWLGWLQTEMVYPLIDSLLSVQVLNWPY